MGETKWSSWWTTKVKANCGKFQADLQEGQIDFDNVCSKDPQETETMNEDDLFADRSLLEEMTNAAKQLLVIIWVFLLFISVDLALEFCEKFFCKVLSKFKRSNEDVEEINKKKID